MIKNQIALTTTFNKWPALCFVKIMKLQIEASAQHFKDLISALEKNEQLEDIKQQIVNGLALENHDQEGDVPKVGDDPIIDRLE